MGKYIKTSENDLEITLDMYNTLKNLWKGTLKFGWLIIVLASLSAAIYCQRTWRNYIPFYTASATFTVNTREDARGTSMYEEVLRASQLSKTFPYIITSSVLRNDIARELGLPYITESIYADTIEDTNLFTIRVTSADPKRAYEVLHLVIDNYSRIAEPVVGRTYLTMLNESGIPTEPYNRISYRASIKKGVIPGGLLGLAFIALYALSRRTIYKVEDLAKLTSIKHLGSLPRVKIKKRSKKKEFIISLQNEKLPRWYQECVYKIRTRVEKIMENKEKTILVTSAIQGEGKSTVAYNLALSLAEVGKKVILVDCDLHNPTIRKRMDLFETDKRKNLNKTNNMESTSILNETAVTLQDTIEAIGCPLEQKANILQDAGLSHVLKGEISLEDALIRYEGLNLSILADLEPINNATEILGTSRMRGLIEELENQADYVILDSPPAAILSDASDLAKLVEGIIYVVKQDYAMLDQILKNFEYLSESSNAEIIGFVLNDTTTSFNGYGYGKGYGYGYGYR